MESLLLNAKTKIRYIIGWYAARHYGWSNDDLTSLYVTFIIENHQYLFKKRYQIKHLQNEERLMKKQTFWVLVIFITFLNSKIRQSGIDVSTTVWRRQGVSSKGNFTHFDTN